MLGHRRNLLIAASGCALVVGACALFAHLAFSGGGDLCVNDNVLETVSPNARLKAVAFRRNCGATTDYSTHISILPAGDKLRNEGGNVFTANHELSLSVHWIDDEHLRVTGETRTHFLRLTEFRGVHISYE